MAEDGSSIEVWGDGKQTRSFLIVDECIDGTLRLLRSDFEGPLNIGSEEMVTINQLAQIVIDVSGKDLNVNHIHGPLGVRGRNSDNRLIQKMLGWAPTQSLEVGLMTTYSWIFSQVKRRHKSES